MDQDHTYAPTFWATELAGSDSDVAIGNGVPALVVHERPRAALAELEAEIAAEGTSAVASSPDP
jgi:hypothetical protein